MTFTCRCGAHQPLPQGSIDLYSVLGDAYVELCDVCTERLVRWVMNQAEIVDELDDDLEWDDLTLPIEDWINEDLVYEIRKEA